MKKKTTALCFILFYLSCGPTRDKRAFDYDISYTYQGEDIVFHVQDKLQRKIPWRAITTVGLYAVKENNEHEVFWYMNNFTSNDLNTELKYGSVPEGFSVKENKKLRHNQKYTFYFIPIAPLREFRLEFVYNPPGHENISK
ncbi:hypothetical protein [Leptospira kmetyi]|uniref:hypothetical protein n=1 Tax=Leptospira kmetyi TaxID=408139 RepID=UPI0010840419|nr:hypothetical protein [Leptospira kmetyi]TGL66534.1 hypothetical protein EHQ67_16090 [Leptospira kmetyi]